MLYVQMLSAVFNIYYKKRMTCNKSTTLINIYVVKVTFCSVKALSAGRGGFSELGAPGKYRNGALYICTHLPRSTLRFLFCRNACCCTMVKVMSKSKSALLSILPHVPYIHTEN